MKEYIKKFELRKVIILMCVIGSLFTLSIGSLGIKLSGKMNENANYIYTYREYTNLIEKINTNILKMKSETLKAALLYEAVHEENIKEYHEIISESIKEYDSTEYETAIEGEYIKNLDNAYKEYYSIVEKLLKSYKGEENLENELELIDRMISVEEVAIQNINNVIDFLDGWAAKDKDTTNNIYTTMIGVYGTIIFVAVVIMAILGAVILAIFKTETRYINEILRRIASGDLSIELEYKDSENEFEKMKLSLKITIDSFRKMISGIKDRSSRIEADSDSLNMISGELSASVDNISNAAGNITENIEEQEDDLNEIVTILDNFSDNIEEFISNLNELNTNSKDITENAERSNSKLDETSVIFKDVETLIGNFIDKIKELGVEINMINGVTNVINELAEQTNLLALNASIESARVGEAGKGFAVVASEISELAEQSRKSANTISEYISRISRETDIIINDSNKLNSKLGRSFNSVTESIDIFKNIIRNTHDIDSKIGKLNTASENISRENEVLYKKIEKSSKRSDDICVLSEEVLSSINEINGVSKHVSETALGLNRLSNELEDDVRVFNTGENNNNIIEKE